MTSPEKNDERRGGSDRRDAIDVLSVRHAELWQAYAELAARLARGEPEVAFESAAGALSGSAALDPERGVMLAAAGLEAFLCRALSERLPAGPVEAALESLADRPPDPDFVDYTLKDLLRQAFDREPVGRRGIKVGTWNQIVDLLSARSALLRAGDRRLYDGFKGDRRTALAAAREWLEAARSVVAMIGTWSARK